MAATFFIGFEVAATEETLPIQLEPKVNEYLALLMQMIFAFGLCFQLPVVMTLLARVGIASSKGMAAKRTYAIVGVLRSEERRVGQECVSTSRYRREASHYTTKHNNTNLII